MGYQKIPLALAGLLCYNAVSKEVKDRHNTHAQIEPPERADYPAVLLGLSAPALTVKPLAHAAGDYVCCDRQ